MGFNSGFKGLNMFNTCLKVEVIEIKETCLMFCLPIVCLVTGASAAICGFVWLIPEM
jgi:hypothetical protein